MHAAVDSCQLPLILAPGCAYIRALAAHWVKHLLHFVFIYKAKARPGWAFLPE
jgi:hypothetical protein